MASTVCPLCRKDESEHALSFLTRLPERSTFLEPPPLKDAEEGTA